MNEMLTVKGYKGSKVKVATVLEVSGIGSAIRGLPLVDNKYDAAFIGGFDRIEVITSKRTRSFVSSAVEANVKMLIDLLEEDGVWENLEEPSDSKQNKVKADNGVFAVVTKGGVISIGDSLGLLLQLLASSKVADANRGSDRLGVRIRRMELQDNLCIRLYGDNGEAIASIREYDALLY